MITRLKHWWARRCAVEALCAHLIDHGEKWNRRKPDAIEILTFGDLKIEMEHRYSFKDSPQNKIKVNGVRMPYFATRKIRKALKRRGSGLKLYRDIASALQPAKTPLQIEEAHKCHHVRCWL